MAKKCPRCIKGAPGWIVTFGDLMSLLLTFFVLLLSFAQLDIVKFKQMAGSLKHAFGVQKVDQINPSPTGHDLIADQFNQEIALVHLAEDMRFVLIDLIDNGDAEIAETGEGFVLEVSNDAFFSQGSVRLRRDIESLLTQVANLLVGQQRSVKTKVVVTGHTDNRPADAKSPYPTNWALAGAYAASVADFLAAQDGMDPTMLEVRSSGHYQPKESNKTESGRHRNRRVEISIVRTGVPAQSAPEMVESAGVPVGPGGSP